MKHIIQYPTQERLKELFDYKDGQLIRKVSSQGAKVGDVLGCKNSNGYIQGRVGGTKFMVHRLIWIWHFGEIPAGLVVDHQNEIKDDNRIENLQLLTQRKNSYRTTVGKSGEKNIYKQGKGWTVEFTIDGEDKYFGTFTTIPEAVTRRDEIKEKYNLF